ncbi:MAG: branched-chain amino acid ABC transporter permease [Chloroflexi bacterium]|nr:branched-chain amino acid ABC transporter permease [Chloroflexota bacterium]
MAEGSLDGRREALETYLAYVLTLATIFVVLVASLNLLMGYTNLLSLAHAAYFGVGAYVAGVAMVQLGLSFWLATPLAIAGTGVLAALLSIPLLRLKDDYFIIATLGMQFIFFEVFYNWVPVTQGPFGLHGIRRPDLPGLSLRPEGLYLVFSIVVTALLFVTLLRLVNSPVGRILKGIREDELMTRLLGKHVDAYKVLAWAVAGAMAGAAGALYGSLLTNIDPSSFDIQTSVLVFLMVVVGGPGSLWGSIAGALVLAVLPEALRFVGIPSQLAPHLRVMLYGFILMLLMVYRRQGLIGEHQVA